jgi:hypothetical protein
VPERTDWPIAVERSPALGTDPLEAHVAEAPLSAVDTSATNRRGRRSSSSHPRMPRSVLRPVPAYPLPDRLPCGLPRLPTR